MNNKCPICNCKAAAEKEYDNTQGYTNEAGKSVIKQGGKHVGKAVGGWVGGIFGAPEIGEAIGGIAGSYLAGEGADEYARTHGSFHYRYSHCGLSWTTDSDEYELVHLYWQRKKMQAKSFGGVGVWAVIGMTFFPYLLLFFLLFLCVMIKIGLFLFLLNNHPVAWAWNILSWWAVHTWLYHLGIIVLFLIVSPFSLAHERKKIQKECLDFFCRKYGLRIEKRKYDDGMYEGTLTPDGQRFGYGTFKQKNGTVYSGPWRNDTMGLR